MKKSLYALHMLKGKSSSYLLQVQYSWMAMLILLLYSSNAIAQLEVTNGNTPPFTPENLVENVFLGAGVDVISVTYTGDPQAVGYFNGDNANIGIGEGILMTSGTASNAIGPNNDAGGTSGTDNDGVTDSDLAAISGQTIGDAAIYTIEFIPYSDTLRFNYVFASEEYPEFSCDEFNDAFGFFISGPGINGPYSNNSENIALIPGTTTPVAIGNVNNGDTNNPCTPSNIGFYVDNTGGATVQYDGFTVPMQAVAVVTPCETYTIKLVIGDAFDQIYDSGVFLAANSFGTNALDIEVTTFSPDSTMVEGCVPAEITFNLATPAEADYPIDYTVFGVAENGVDYSPVANNGTIPAGASEFTITFTPIEDNVIEGREPIYIAVQTSICGIDTFTLYIDDNSLVAPQIDDVTICEGDTVTLDATVPIETPPDIVATSTTSYPIPDNNTLSPIISPLNVNGVIPGTIGASSIQSICIDITHSYVGDLDIFLISPDGQFLELSSDNGGSGNNYANTCFTPGATMIIEGTTNTSPPYAGNYVPEGDWTGLYNGTANGTWQLQVSDDSNGFAGTLNSWSITFRPVYEVNYTWSPNANVVCPTEDCAMGGLYPATTTTYTALATDSYGCTSEDSATVTVINCDCGLTSNLDNSSQVSCNGGSDGSVTVSAMGGDLPHSFSINNGTPQANGSFSGLAAGVYSVAIEDNADCINTISVTITEPTVMVVTPIATDVSCNGGNNGSATVLVSEGTGPYTYLWNDPSGQSTNSAANLTAGAYIVTITDANSCTTTETITLQEPTALTAVTVGVGASCAGNTDGSATVTPSGGTGLYTYLWDDPASQTTATATNLGLGTYTVVVTDENGCTVTATSMINAPVAVVIDNISTTDASCGGALDGSATVTASGGTMPYMYDVGSGVQSANPITGLASGTYTLIVTDANNCTATMDFTIDNPSNITTSISSTPVSCFGENQGTATIVASGGTGTLTYEWSDANTQTTTTATTLVAGTYTVVITDGNGCTTSDMVDVIQPDALALTETHTDVSCNGENDGSATISVTGGSGNYTYLWDDASNTTTAVPTTLTAGTYTPTVTDGNGCSETIQVVIGQPAMLTAITTNPINSTCNGGSDGSITAFPTGGTEPYTYLWNDPNAQITAVATGLMAGAYDVIVTDANNCITIASGTIGEAAPLVVDDIATTDANCGGVPDGTATITVSGGTAPYSYSLNGATQTSNFFGGLIAGGYTLDIIDLNGCTISETFSINNPVDIESSITATPISCNGGSNGTATVTASGGTGTLAYVWSDSQQGTTATNLSAGTYIVSITDDNGCLVTENVDVIQPDSFDVGLVVTNVNCNGESNGSIAATVTGATAPYSYQWNDANNQITATASNLPIENYTLTIQDANGCITTVSETVTEPTILTATATGTNISCFGGNDGTTTVSPTGGVEPYTYLWDDPNGFTTEMTTGLTAGTYTATVTDANGCTTTAMTTISEPAAPVSLTVSTTPVSCNAGTDGTTSVVAAGGTSPYSYVWNDDNAQATTTAINLAAGMYTVTVTDANDCSETISITVIEPTQMVATIDFTAVSCGGYSDGTATVTPSEGTPPYTYEWSDGNGQTTATAIDLLAGLYTVTVTDANLCEIERTITITEPAPISLSLSVTNVSCNGGSDGTATVAASAGTGPYTYLWNDVGNQTTFTATNLLVGTYTVTVTDANDCTTSSSIEITEPEVLTIEMSATPVLCTGENNGTVSSVVMGGTEPYTYTWNNGESTASISNLSAGIYSVLVVDANNCTINGMIEVEAPNALLIEDISSTLNTCNGGSNGTTTVVASGGVGLLTYAWSDAANQTTTTATGLPVGTYTVTVTDQNNCAITQDVVVGEPTAIVLALQQLEVSCFGGNDGTATVEAVGGTVSTGYSYLWSNGQNTMTAINLNGGATYTVTVTDNNGCTKIQSIIIGEPAAITLTATSTPTSCHFGADGTATVSAAGGTPPYTYLWGANAGSVTTTTATDLASALYGVTVTDVNGCTANTQVNVLQPTRVQLEISVDAVSCYGDQYGGAISVIGNGGTPPYTYLWNDANNSISAAVDSLATGMYAVTITDANGCFEIDSAFIPQPPLLTATVAEEDVTCFGARDGQITVFPIGGTPPYTYSADGEIYGGSSILIGLIGGEYTVHVRDLYGCEFSLPASIGEPEELTLDLGLDLSMEFADSVQLTATHNATGPITYNWVMSNVDSSMSCYDCWNPIVSPDYDNIYTLTITNENGCQEVDAVIVRVNFVRRIFIPNAFTPNGDGTNDIFMAHGGRGTEKVALMNVYDRWGELVFSAGNIPLNDETVGWDGTFQNQQVNPGVYGYMIEIEFTDGKKILYNGDITVIR